METFRKISVGEKLPADNVQVQVEYNGDYYRAYHNVSTWYNCNEGHMGQPIYPQYWFEEIKIELESEVILPTGDRIQKLYSNASTYITCVDEWEDKYGNFEHAIYLIDKYHKALEAAEYKNLELLEELNQEKEIGDMLDENLTACRKNAHEIKSEEYQRGFMDCYQQQSANSLEMMREVFSAGRKINIDLYKDHIKEDILDITDLESDTTLKYDTFEDYLKSRENGKS